MAYTSIFHIVSRNFKLAQFMTIAAIMTVLFLSSITLVNQVHTVPKANAELVDKFGVKMLYSTKPGSYEEWYMDMANPSDDKRFDPQNTITKNSDGSWKMKSDKVRMYIFTSTGYDKDKIATYDEKQLASKGYMQSPNDWKNVEMTGYIKLNAYSSSDDKFQWYNRGGRHIDPEPCEGTGYKGNLFYSGEVLFAKEQWHNRDGDGYVFTDHKDIGIDSIKGRWIGYKYVVYNFEQNGKTVVKMENWLDKNNDGNWIKVDENVDDGRWGDKGKKCRGAPDQIISWGGPIATFRWDNAKDVDFKNLSVREIQAQ